MGCKVKGLRFWLHKCRTPVYHLELFQKLFYFFQKSCNLFPALTELIVKGSIETLCGDREETLRKTLFFTEKTLAKSKTFW